MTHYDFSVVEANYYFQESSYLGQYFLSPAISSTILKANPAIVNEGLIPKGLGIIEPSTTPAARRRSGCRSRTGGSGRRARRTASSSSAATPATASSPAARRRETAMPCGPVHGSGERHRVQRPEPVHAARRPARTRSAPARAR